MSFWDNTLLVGCRDCGVLVLHPATCHTTTPPDEASEEFIAAFWRFVADHQSHAITWLQRHGTEVASDRALWDPMATITFEATDGHQVYLVNGGRAAVEEPRIYRFAPGTLDVTNSEILIDDRDLRRGLDVTFYPHALRLTKLDRFVSVVRDVVSHLNPDALTVAFDDAEDPAVSVARMPDETYQELLARCAEIFDPSEFDTLTKFLQSNRYEDGLLALRVRREYRALPA
ncbi:MAG TPA: hypothetical protein VF515_11180 [Candidatus Binatia bacterium]|jgi:hypothetical protein